MILLKLVKNFRTSESFLKHFAAILLYVYFIIVCSKAIYERLFNWIVTCVNNAIDVKKKFKQGTIIGVLDIYGFEIFDKNRSEMFDRVSSYIFSWIF